jgi:NAD(P)-dependent dehydrogenase (short-subunit alcohol dehydrogenase family)
LHYIACDLFSQKSVRLAVEQFSVRFARLDVLLNNAGGLRKDRVIGEDGIEWTYAVNVVGPLLLSHLLLDKIKAAPKGRIVNVVSMAEKAGRIDLKNLTGEKKFSMFSAYCNAKLAETMISYELARELEKDGITVNCMHPGVVRTNFGKDNTGGITRSLISISGIFMISPEKGAETLVHLATSDEAEGITGNYWNKCKAVPSSDRSYDKTLSAEVYKATMTMAHLG